MADGQRSAALRTPNGYIDVIITVAALTTAADALAAVAVSFDGSMTRRYSIVP